MRKETRIQKIVRLTAKRFPSFGNNKIVIGNPISAALAGHPPQFAGGVDIGQVVRFVIARNNRLLRAHIDDHGDDQRDYANTTYYYRRLSSKALELISHLKPREMKIRLRDADYPFNRIGVSDREILLNLPTSWIYGSATLLLRTKKFNRTHPTTRKR